MLKDNINFEAKLSTYMDTLHITCTYILSFSLLSNYIISTKSLLFEFVCVCVYHGWSKYKWYLTLIFSSSFSFSFFNIIYCKTFPQITMYFRKFFLSTTYTFFLVIIGLDNIYGRIIALDQVCGKEQVVGRSYPSVAVMMIRPQQILT